MGRMSVFAAAETNISSTIDEDELLYGDSDLYSSSTTDMGGGLPSASASNATGVCSEATVAHEDSATYWAVFALDDGSLEVRSLAVS